MKKKPATLEKLINQFCQDWARTNRRPDMGDNTTRSMFSVELSRQIRKYARVIRKAGSE